MSGRRMHSASTLVLSLLMATIGVALIVQAVSGHGSIVSPRLLLGVLFFAAGGGRIYLQVRRSREAS
jgi:predicted membrane channel-forming protein YqfA (hemolysin III family)